MKAYKDIKRLGSTQILDNFMTLISKYVKLSDIIFKKCNHFRKLEYLHWIKIDCQLAINNDSRKWWKWIKKNIKTGKFSSCLSNPISNKDVDIVISTSDKLKVWHIFHLIPLVRVFINHIGLILLIRYYISIMKIRNEI